MERCKWIWDIRGNNQQVMITDWIYDSKEENFKEASEVFGLSIFIKSDCHSLKYGIFVSKKGMQIDHVGSNRPL